MVDHGLEISSQPIAERIQVGGCRRSNCSKLQADDSVVTKMEAVHLFHAKGNETFTVTGEQYASLLEQFVFLALQARCCDTTHRVKNGSRAETAIY